MHTHPYVCARILYRRAQQHNLRGMSEQEMLEYALALSISQDAVAADNRCVCLLAVSQLCLVFPFGARADGLRPVAFPVPMQRTALCTRTWAREVS